MKPGELELPYRDPRHSGFRKNQTRINNTIQNLLEPLGTSLLSLRKKPGDMPFTKQVFFSEMNE
jgi:hypothetical protein